MEVLITIPPTILGIWTFAVDGERGYTFYRLADGSRRCRIPDWSSPDGDLDLILVAACPPPSATVPLVCALDFEGRKQVKIKGTYRNGYAYFVASVTPTLIPPKP